MSCKTLLIFMCVVSYHAAWAAGNGSESRVVSTEQGPVRGYKDAQNDLFVFYNIPYARTPTGRDKFKAPLPAPQRTEIFEAIDRNVICPQSEVGNFFNITGKIMQEDCLITNIYVPDTNETNLPVMINIHQGGFWYGFGEFITPKSLVQSKRIISLNFNYRLGAHGFLCLGTEGAPGNAGLKDQVAFLRWVKANIANFGGNPNDVTIAGCSAGSMSADILSLSKAANGLFNKIIAGSGGSLGSLTVQHDPIRTAQADATALNFTNVNDLGALEQFYRNASLDLITSIGPVRVPDGSALFLPCVERDLGTERILEDAPYNILIDGAFKQFPMLYGFAEMEGIFILEDNDESLDFMNEHFQLFLPANLQFDSTQQRNEVAERVRNFYFGSRNISSETVLSYIDYFTDTLFAYPMLEALRLRALAGNSLIYLYEYSFVDANTPVIPGTNIRGANHCAQEYAVFDEDETSITEEYRSMKAAMREIWLEFITTGIPVPDSSSLPTWPTAGVNRSPYMQLNRPLNVTNSPLLQHRMSLWDDIYERHYLAPIPPSGSAVSHIIQTKWIICLLVVNFISYLAY